jgi:hypothetical protein
MCSPHYRWKNRSQQSGKLPAAAASKSKIEPLFEITNWLLTHKNMCAKLCLYLATLKFQIEYLDRQSYKLREPCVLFVLGAVGVPGLAKEQSSNGEQQW